MSAIKQNSDKLDIDFESVFTEAQIHEIEEKYDTTWGVNRRIMMVVLSKSGKSMTDILESMLSEDKVAETYFSMIKQLEDYEQHLKFGIELAQVAIARLLMVAQHAAGDEAEPSSE